MTAFIRRREFITLLGASPECSKTLSLLSTISFLLKIHRVGNGAWIS